MKTTSCTFLTFIYNQTKNLPERVKLRMANKFEANMPITVSSLHLHICRHGKVGYDLPIRRLPCPWDG